MHVGFEVCGFSWAPKDASVSNGLDKLSVFLVSSTAYPELGP